MEISPDFPSFSATFEAGKSQVIWATLLSDLETPVSAMLKLSQGQHNCFLLESVEGGANRGRYSFIGLAPDLIWKASGTQAEINTEALTKPDAFEICPSGVIESLRTIINDSMIDLPDGLPPMAAGLVGYMSYDMVRLFERLPDDNPDVLGVPDGVFVRPTVVAVFDNIEDTIKIITLVRPGSHKNAQDSYNDAVKRLQDTIKRLDETPVQEPRRKEKALQKIDFEKQSNISRSPLREEDDRDHSEQWHVFARRTPP